MHVLVLRDQNCMLEAQCLQWQTALLLLTNFAYHFDYCYYDDDYY